MLTPINAPGGAFPGVSQAMQISGGDLLILSGHVGTDANGNLVEGGFEAQLRATYENLRATLDAAGVGFEAVARMTHYVTEFDPSLLPILRKVRAEFINNDAPPSAALVPLVQLYDKAVLVEVDGFAVLPSKTRIS
ncbi:enamine deaminase RidA (YjgF/YER057c/UK114 family) [Paraburkholderia sp. BL27I4N3]|uniref:RidA family protein n=1 Tax=Paraburkholderia sp. BL27I4N3 TaxID=1938805 RepID=UPI000E235E10|nr:RidA family protein [Paraburkholderia sp. BL27I4N3]REE18142.1 enamine deaminase RidA (YjgF/YER057c/UK114 family) [Paraburkholderia sp. BL27I4N3]